MLNECLVLRVLGLKKASKYDLCQKCQNQNRYFWILSKFPSGINSTHPFYPILIPNTLYGKFSFFFFLFLCGPLVWTILKKCLIYFDYGVWKDFFNYCKKLKNYFCTGCSESTVRECKLIFVCISFLIQCTSFACCFLVWNEQSFVWIICIST